MLGTVGRDGCFADGKSVEREGTINIIILTILIIQMHDNHTIHMYNIKTNNDNNNDNNNINNDI